MSECHIVGNHMLRLISGTLEKAIPLHISLDSDIVTPSYLTVLLHRDDLYLKPEILKEHNKTHVSSKQ